MIASATPTAVVHRMTVTPEMALNWLEHANNHNRPVSQKYAERLACDMRNGRWVLTHEGVAFDPNGVLLDGQHRLWAVAFANVPVEMHVWLNVSPESLMVINNGRVRSLADNLRLGGGCGDVDKNQLATLRAMLGKGHDVALTAAEARQELARHEDAIAFASKHLPPVAGARGISTSETRAVVARAYYSADIKALTDFCDVLRTSIAPFESFRVVVMLRNYLMTSVGGSRALRQERYRKMQRALKAFLRSEDLTRLYAAEGELFPLPGETVQ
jgi:hypothetical protein